MDSSDNNDPLRTLDELEYLLPVLNMAFFARATGKGRPTIKNWLDDRVDMLGTQTRQEARKIILQILQEIHDETGLIISNYGETSPVDPDMVRGGYRHLSPEEK